MSEDINHPPSREGLTDAQVWVWSGDHWQVRTLDPDEVTNAGGSASPGE